MKYSHRFRVNAPLATVATFHRRSASMASITPPPIFVDVHRASSVLAEGDDMEFTMWMGPLPIHWVARIEEVSPTGFVDRQIVGPFKQWIHRHRFVVVGEGVTEVVDEVYLSLHENTFWKTVGLGMWLGLPLLFSFRAWKTRRLLAGTEDVENRVQAE